ncbi:MAG: hypothetical protein RBR14_05655 [Candidatus Cloacimonas acidaminovorans]|nr:hypothetical protein [Candidatus Cloacimonas acidaminovorans]
MKNNEIDIVVGSNPKTGENRIYYQDEMIATIIIGEKVNRSISDEARRLIVVSMVSGMIKKLKEVIS